MVLKKVCKVTTVVLVATVTYILAFNKPADSSSEVRVIYEHVDASTLDQAHCLATNLYFEAGHQDRREQEAIAHVVLNRVEDSSFPDTICGVVYDGVHKRNGLPYRNKCQFSWYCDGKADTIENHTLYDNSMRIALQTMISRKDDNLTDFTNNSLWYHANYIRPYWADDYKFQINEGLHIFYSRR